MLRIRLAKEMIIARKEAGFERTLRFLKRNRLAVVVCALILLSLGIGERSRALSLLRRASALKTLFPLNLDARMLILMLACL